MGGKHRKSRYDSSSLSATDTSDSSSSESSDCEVSFVANHSHRHKSQHRINKLKHKKNKKHKKDRRLGHQALRAQNHVTVNTKNISIMVQNIIKSKSITQILTPTEQIIRRDIAVEILMAGISKIELHTTQKGINLIIDITIEIKINMTGHQKQIPMIVITGIGML